ncbi:hypothetical protein GJ700_32315 [Duganella sp. FT92W]|uniref:Calcineurin-like phosphoesterase domain-containing protein n=1 Tax=Pseudoduganella rivuli TaxID=2666085 RepID=A0A7X2IUK4_9BURK|nr:metallophosphoesterase [Pseudoduganella rivuli]MRV76406.1 hypothetical protein [Pseudoduganella rivuli]
MRKWLILVLAWFVSSAQGQLLSLSTSGPGPRPIFVISDLHLGVGKLNGRWHPMEDFRWPKAFDGFLKQVSADNPKGAHLVIAGDFLELWQHPTVACAQLKDTECGCTVEEMQRIVDDVLTAHPDEFRSIEAFLVSPNNAVTIIPGNHDAALIDDVIWERISTKINKGRDRFTRASNGSFTSDDGKIIVEHGHQQAFDVNSFPYWPGNVKLSCGTEVRYFRPWGENFVQSLYNDVEIKFPLVDNIVPDSAGAQIYKTYSEEIGTKWADMAKFIKFNLLQTSTYQKVQALNLPNGNEELSEEEVQRCQACLSDTLLTLENPLGQRTIAIESADALRGALKATAEQLRPEEARALCTRMATLQGGQLDLQSAGSKNPLCEKSLATGVRGALDPDGTAMVKQRIQELYDRQNGRLSVYVYGHTHESKKPFAVRVKDGLRISAANTGAFQRLMNVQYLDSKLLPNEGRIKALERLTHTDLASCYSVIKLGYDGRRVTNELKQWYMPESEEKGVFLDACDPLCSAPPANCPLGK